MPDLAGLKICFISGTLGQGGAERQLFYMARALTENGARVRVLSLTRGEHWEAPLAALGVSVTWVGASASRAARLVRICRELRRDRPDVVQSQHFFTNIYAAAAGRLLGLPAIGAIRSNLHSELKTNGPLLGSLSLRLPGMLAVNSRPAYQAALDSGVPARRLYLLPNVVDTERFQPAARNGRRSITVLGAGRMTQEKRFDRFLSVIAQARAQYGERLRAVIAGAGPLRAELEGRAADLGLMPSGVDFLGPLADLASVYQKADLLLLTSEYEGAPNVVLESMACGLPVVATRAGSVPELVREGVTGYVADPPDEDVLAEGLVRLARDENMRHWFGCQARSFIERNYSTRILPNALEALYARALSRQTALELTGAVEPQVNG